MRSLNKAMNRQVKVDILLEKSIEQGGRTNNSIKAMTDLLPSANFYVWEHSDIFPSINKFVGAVHAKCAVADGKLAFITSANLTTAAMERDMELGVLIKEGKLPKSLDRHLEALKTTGIIKQI